jgi:hypothetical protein
VNILDARIEKETTDKLWELFSTGFLGLILFFAILQLMASNKLSGRAIGGVMTLLFGYATFRSFARLFVSKNSERMRIKRAIFEEALPWYEIPPMWEAYSKKCEKIDSPSQKEECEKLKRGIEGKVVFCKAEGEVVHKRFAQGVRHENFNAPTESKNLFQYLLGLDGNRFVSNESKDVFQLLLEQDGKLVICEVYENLDTIEKMATRVDGSSGAFVKIIGMWYGQPPALNAYRFGSGFHYIQPVQEFAKEHFGATVTGYVVNAKLL